MNVEKIMTTTVKAIGERTSILSAANTMDESWVGFLPVLDEAGKPVGVLTDRDIAIRCVAEGVPSDFPVAEAMTSIGYSLRADQEIGEALDLMKAHKIARVMVTDGSGTLVGVVSLDDATIACPGDPRIAEVHEALRSRARRMSAPAR